MSKKIAVALAALMLLVIALPASAAIQKTSVEVRGTVASGAPSSGQLDDNVNASWSPNNFAGFYYDLKDDIGTENLNIVAGTLGGTDRTIEQDKLQYTTQGQGKTLKVVSNAKATNTSTNGLEKFGDGDMAVGFGKYNIVGWQAEPYVGIKNRSYKLAKLLLEQGNATSEKKTLTIGETWDIGGGWTLTANSIDAKASPRQVWLTLSKDGVKKDDKVVAQGAVYTYVEKSIGGESDVPLFVTYIDSVFAGATSDMAQLRFTWVIDTSITEIKGGDKFGVFKVQSIDPQIKLNNTDNTVTLSKDTSVDLMGNMKFRVADSDTVRIYPKVDYEIVGAGVTPGATETAAVTGTATVTGTAKATPKGNVTVTAAATAAVVETAKAPEKTPKPTATPKEPGFEAVFAIAGLLAVAYLVLRRK